MCLLMYTPLPLDVLIYVSADYNNIGKFLNRILGMEVHQQNALFQYFSDTLAAVIQEAKRNGRYDMGILGKAQLSFSTLMVNHSIRC